MISKEEIENMKKYFNECITKNNVFEENLTIYFMSIATKYIQQLETKEQKVIDKLEELKKKYKETLENNSTKAFILKCQIEILEEIMKGEEECVNIANLKMKKEQKPL